MKLHNETSSAGPVYVSAQTILQRENDGSDHAALARWRNEYEDISRECHAHATNLKPELESRTFEAIDRLFKAYFLSNRLFLGVTHPEELRTTIDAHKTLIDHLITYQEIKKTMPKVLLKMLEFLLEKKHESRVMYVHLLRWLTLYNRLATDGSLLRAARHFDNEVWSRAGKFEQDWIMNLFVRHLIMMSDRSTGISTNQFTQCLRSIEAVYRNGHVGRRLTMTAHGQ